MFDGFEWDERKARINLEKHGIDFADAIAVLNDDSAIVIPDEHPGEERFAVLGVDLRSGCSLRFLLSAVKTFGSSLRAKLLGENPRTMGKNGEERI